MKIRRLSLSLACILILALLCGCGQDNTQTEEDSVRTFDEATAAPTQVPMATAEPLATLEPSSGSQTYDTSTAFQTYTTLSDTSLGFTFEYPSTWVSKPGVFTICLTENNPEKSFLPRVAITRKKLVHTASETTITNQLKAYLKVIYKQYDKSTFKVGSLDKELTFMGDVGYSTTYLAFSGETEVKGFVILTQIERTLYVFHFCASYADYTAMEDTMWHMCNSVTIA